ncbi:MAG: nucleotidyltransferase substrate binding protein [Campylobacterota bacterium]
MSDKTIRWKQRFENFSKSLNHLADAVEIEHMSEIEKAGMIQFFEVSFELAWKVLKDYLEAEGFNVKSPRESIKQAFQVELINDGTTWLDALEKRNLSAHTYDENILEELQELIRHSYFPVMFSLQQKLQKEV